MRAAVTRGTLLTLGLIGYGFSMGVMVRAGLGLDPWDVFHQGLTRHLPITLGTASAAVGVVVLLAWIPLRNRPGVGTVANIIVIAVTVDATLAVLPEPSAMPVRIAMMVGAVVLNAISTVLYIGAGLGPLDAYARGVADAALTVLAVGWLLGGTVGVGTVVYAFGIGPLVQFFLRITPRRLLFHDFGSPGTGRDRSRRERITTMGPCPQPEKIDKTVPTVSTQTC